VSGGVDAHAERVVFASTPVRSRKGTAGRAAVDLGPSSCPATCHTRDIDRTGGSRLEHLRVRAFGTDDAPRIGTLARPARAVTRPLMKLLYRARVIGAENIPTDGPAIISPNHRSFFDSPLIMAMTPRPVVFLGKSEYMDNSKTKYLFPAFGMVPIKRDVKRASMAALHTAAELLDAGELVGIYPEGTRSRDGFLHRGHTGVAHLAVMTGAPIIPVGIIGTERAQPIGAAVPRPFRGPITVRFGEPIHPDRYRYGGSRKRRQQMLDDVMASIAAMTDQERSPEFSSDEPPLIRGGSESVYRVTTHRATGLSWRQAAERIVDDACNHYDDARVAEVNLLRCRVMATGQIEFGAELKLSTKFRAETRTTRTSNTRSIT
jgi:1-acyl-sn-glycerol-3-phosphate acyltransferase